METPRFVEGSGEWEGWIFVWHEVGGRLHESRFRAEDIPKMVEELMAFYWRSR